MLSKCFCFKLDRGLTTWMAIEFVFKILMCALCIRLMCVLNSNPDIFDATNSTNTSSEVTQTYFATNGSMQSENLPPHFIHHFAYLNKWYGLPTIIVCQLIDMVLTLLAIFGIVKVS